MRVALEEAAVASVNGEIPVGAIVVAGDRIVGRGHNRSIGLSDPTAHAEVMALRDAGARIGNYRLPETILYVTLEPCPMCAGAITMARVPRLVIGAWNDEYGAVGSRWGSGRRRTCSTGTRPTPSRCAGSRVRPASRVPDRTTTPAAERARRPDASRVGGQGSVQVVFFAGVHHLTRFLRRDVQDRADLAGEQP